MADPQSNAALPAHPLSENSPRAGVLHVRHRHTDRFTVVGNHLAQHPRLSATAIGLAVHIQSLPDGASVTAKALTLRFPEGETTIRKALNELEAAGYLDRPRVPLGGGRFATRTFSYEKPGCGMPKTAKARPKPAYAVTADPCPTSAPLTARRVSPVDASLPVLAKPSPTPAPPPPRTAPTSCPAPSASGPAAAILARLRVADPRLLLSSGDVDRLAPAVGLWLARSATPEQITRTLTANLPPDPVPVHHPARFLEHRLLTLLPPPLPAAPLSASRAPLVNCEGCDRAFRTHDPDARCADCRTVAVPAVAG